MAQTNYIIAFLDLIPPPFLPVTVLITCTMQMFISIMTALTNRIFFLFGNYYPPPPPLFTPQRRLLMILAVLTYHVTALSLLFTMTPPPPPPKHSLLDRLLCRCHNDYLLGDQAPENPALASTDDLSK